MQFKSNSFNYTKSILNVLVISAYRSVSFMIYRFNVILVFSCSLNFVYVLQFLLTDKSTKLYNIFHAYILLLFSPVKTI